MELSVGKKKEEASKQASSTSTSRVPVANVLSSQPDMLSSFHLSLHVRLGPHVMLAFSESSHLALPQWLVSAAHGLHIGCTLVRNRASSLFLQPYPPYF
jgi:hypothetical protein